MSNVYCGVGPVPKNKKRGSMKDCAEQGQIRYFGIKKIDSRLLAAVKKSGKKASRNNLMRKFGSIKGKMNKINKDMKYEKNAKTKTQMQKDIVKLSKELSEVSKQLKSMSGGSRHGLRHESRHGLRHESRHELRHESRHGLRHGSRHGSKYGSRHGSKHGSRHGLGHGLRQSGGKKHSKSRKHSRKQYRSGSKKHSK